MRPTPPIYKLIETALRNASEPMTCNDLYDLPEINAEVESSKRLSNHLGHLWRKKKLDRWYNNDITSGPSTYAYSLKETGEPKLKLVKSVAGEEKGPPVEYRVSSTEDALVIEVEDFKITIQRK